MGATGQRTSPSLKEITDDSYATWLQGDPEGQWKPVLNTPVDRIYIVGAGASLRYGLPPLKTLTWELAQTLNSEDRAVLLSAIFECFDVNLQQPNDSPDFEELLNRLDPNALRYLTGIGLDEKTGFRNNAIRLALSSLRTFIRNRCFAAADEMGPYDHLVASLDERTAIVSFNWDVLLEIALRRAGRVFRYLPTARSPVGTVLLKPHGSINWFALLDRELLYVAKDSNLAVFGDDLYYYLLYVTDPLAPIEFGRSTVEYALSKVPAIVPPSALKLLSVGGVPRDGWVEGGHARAMRDIWHTFKLMLDQASELVIIGYSLPGTDASSITLLKRYASDTSSKPKRVRLVEPKRAVAERYEVLLRTGVEVVCRDFGSFDPGVL